MKMIEKRNHKLISIIFTLMLTFAIYPNIIKAETGTISIECEESTLESGKTAQCYLKGKNFTNNAPSFHAKLTLSNSLTLTTITKDSSWEGACDGGIIDLYTDNNKTGNFNIASFSFQIPSSINKIIITLDEIAVSDENFNEINLPKVTKTITLNGGGNNNPNDDDQNDEPSTTTTTTKINTTKIVTTQKKDTNVDDNPKTGFNPISLLVVLVIAILSMVLLVKKNAGGQNE